MKIEVRFTPAMVESSVDVHGRTAVVIDTLRATTTIVAALMAGAREVVPVESPADAVSVAHLLGTDRTLLCGERGSLKIEGFHLGNSPGEYTPEVVRGKTLVLTTTNGTHALLKTSHAERVLCGSLNNARATAERIAHLAPNEVIVICAGTQGRFAIEDALAAGALALHLESFDAAVQLDDGARASLSLFRDNRSNLVAALSSGDHGSTLVASGMREDVELCARLDIPGAVVPTLIGSTIRLDEVLESTRATR